MEILLAIAIVVSIMIIILIVNYIQTFKTTVAKGLGIVPVITPALFVDATVLGGPVAGPASGSQGAPTSPDYPRNVKFLHGGVNSTFPYTVTITGTLADGSTGQTETISVTGAGTFIGVKAWAYISNWNLGTGIAAGDSVMLQSGSKIGMGFKIYAAGDLRFTYKNGTQIAAASYTVNTTNNTIEQTGVAVAANDIYVYFIYHRGAI